jgi:tetratricopeptide (TPR) repeat protein
MHFSDRVQNAKLTFMLIGALLCSAFAHAQQPVALYDRSAIYHEALDLFEHNQYVMAKARFEDYMSKELDKTNSLRINAAYYQSICALQLKQPDAEFLVNQFILDFPHSPWVHRAYFYLGEYYWSVSKKDKALEWLSKVQEKNLEPEQIPEFKFKRAECNFQKGERTSSRQDFYDVKQMESIYQKPALYYYSHILYEENDLQKALEGFLALENDSTYETLTPYYITYIYYKQKKYDQVSAYGPKAMSKAEKEAPERQPEISRMIGDAYCMQEKYEEALPYLERFHKSMTNRDSIHTEDYYQLGFAYHRTAQVDSARWDKAIDAYGRCKEKGNPELYQRANYNIGECYIRKNDKKKALIAFQVASQLTYNAEVQEDALFNYAKLAYELSFNPFHEAITAFEDYLKKYPNSKRSDEAYEFLLDVYLKSKNYERAMTALDKIKNKDNRVKEAYQVAAYNRAVELYQQDQLQEADAMFDKVSTYTVNTGVIADAKFWKAEISYRQRAYSKAAERYRVFLSEAGAFNSPFYGAALYGQGYAYFKLGIDEDNDAESFLSNANTAFRKYIDGNHPKENTKLNDCYMRAGDCFLALRNYGQAIIYYDKAIDNNASGREYAMYQKAMAYGYDGDESKKAWVLKNLIREYPNSPYEVDSKFELAKSYLSEGRLDEAMTYYNDIKNNYPSNPYAKLSLRDICLIYVKKSDTPNVKSSWVEMKTKYRNDPVVCDTYTICKDVLIEDAEFQQDAMIICGASKNEVESDVFSKAEIAAQDGDCTNAINKLNDYLTKFQPASHKTEAHQYLAQCYLKLGDKNKSLESFNEVIAQGPSNYLEEALSNAASISFEFADYSQAIIHYRNLEQVAVSKNNVVNAQLGMMKCHYILKESNESITYADRILNGNIANQEAKMTARLWKGRILKEQAKYTEATTILREVEKGGGVEGAEAKYLICEILYLSNKCREAEDEVFLFIENFGGYDDWKYRAYLLLIDIYICQEDLYQARSTANLLLDKVKVQWVIDAANAKKAEIDRLENPAQENVIENTDQNEETDE